MTNIADAILKYDPSSGVIDAFGRLRVANPTTLIDTKQLFDNLPLVYDDQQTSGSGTTSTHSTARASSLMAVAATTAGTRVRQTLRRLNYETGKSQLFFATFVMGAGGTGITKRVGYFDDDNGLFLQQDDGDLSLNVRTSVSGSAVTTSIAQADWNLDKFDGTSQELVLAVKPIPAAANQTFRATLGYREAL